MINDEIIKKCEEENIKLWFETQIAMLENHELPIPRDELIELLQKNKERESNE